MAEDAAKPPTASGDAGASTPTAAGQDGAKTGSGGAQDPPSSEKTFSKFELEYHIVKRTEKLAAELAEAKERLDKLNGGTPPETTKKSTEDKLYEKFLEKHQPELEKERKARIEAEQRAEAVELRSFAREAIGETFHPDLALAVFGLGYEPPERLAKKDGKFVVVDRDGTAMPHKDPAKWIKEKLDSTEFDFLRRGTAGGGGKTSDATKAAIEAAKQPAAKPVETVPEVRHMGDAKRLARELLRKKAQELENEK